MVAKMVRGKGDFWGLLNVVFDLGECLSKGPFRDFILHIFLLKIYSVDNSGNNVYEFCTFIVLLLIKSDIIIIGNPDSQG